MKDILSIFLFVALLILTSCEPLGIEVKTVKGKWKSDKTNGQNLLLNLEDDDIYSSQTILNDSILLSQKQGTWILKKDTLFIYRQNVENNGLHKLHIEQLSMNTMTLRQIKDEDILVFNRVYSNQNLDYDGRFNEVFNLKKGFWWYAWILVEVICFIMMCIYLFYLVGRLIKICQNVFVRKYVKISNHLKLFKPINYYERLNYNISINIVYNGFI